MTFFNNRKMFMIVYITWICIFKMTRRQVSFLAMELPKTVAPAIAVLPKNLEKLARKAGRLNNHLLHTQPPN